jgi:NAD(P)-dependent dehydrogenase (short-subunit alcohol dehydrogenase family)
MNGRNALITGASLGIGLAMAKRFVQSGANVALNARREDVLEAAVAEVSAHGAGKVIAVAGDVSTAQGCADVFAAASKLGSVDVLVNNAGSSATGKFEDITDDMWMDDLQLKLFAAIRLSRLAIGPMKKAKWGRIINVLNTAAKAAPAQGAPTAVSRAAGMSLTKVLAGDGAPHNVLVNALLVGRIESDQWVTRAAAAGTPIDDYYQEMGAGLPMGRVGTAEEFANMACLLASDQGSYVTGTAINIDGGLCPVV